MLVLSGIRGKSITLHRDGQVFATVTVVDIRGDKVRLGFDAPQDVGIDRSEVFNGPTYIPRKVQVQDAKAGIQH